jgi:hypothetical protein
MAMMAITTKSSIRVNAAETAPGSFGSTLFMRFNPLNKARKSRLVEV